MWVGCLAHFLKPLPYFRPVPYMYMIAATQELLRFALTLVKGFKFPISIKMHLSRDANNKKIASSKNRTYFQTGMHKPYPGLFQTKQLENHTHVPI